ncbi:hypothetical protein GC170_03200 [bacterium]|nr:hypothetical protein [bacterium]
MKPGPLLCGIVSLVFVAFAPVVAFSHDLPKQRVDRTVQLRFAPGRLIVDYTLELDDTTIARDLKRLRNAEELPPDPDEWLDQYGRLVAPQIASALKIDFPEGQPAPEWKVDAIERRREIHTIYAFRFRIDPNLPGRYRFRDTNFGTSDGVSRLGVEAEPGTILKSDGEYPASAASEPYRPVWMLDEPALRKTVEWTGTVEWPKSRPDEIARPSDEIDPSSIAESQPEGRFRGMRLGIFSAIILGMLHTLQPGHGKTLLAAAALTGDRRKRQGLAIVAGWVGSHFAVIFLLAALSLILSDTSLLTISASLKKIAGFLIACPAAYRLGERIRSFTASSNRSEAENVRETTNSAPAPHAAPSSGLITGITAGLIPCWEAIGLLLLGIAAGHVITGLGLVAAFMAGSLVVVAVSMRAIRLISPILDPNLRSGQFLMIGLDMVVLATGANLLLASAFWQPFRS